MNSLLFDPECHLSKKRFRNDQYEASLCKLRAIGSRKKRGIMFTSVQAAQLLANNLKISADGSINTHSDVNTISPTTGEILSWDGTNWTNHPILLGLSTTDSAQLLANNLKVSADGSINTHRDVNTMSPSIGEILAWDGVNWSNASQITGITPIQASNIITNNSKVSAEESINTHQDVEITNPIEGDVLRYDGTKWKNSRP